jgi:small subunit ribosomal protein S23
MSLGSSSVVACTIHLHKNHSLSLSQAYHHTLSSYHALRAEHEHASRSAVLEAQAYGAVFTTTSSGEASAAVEIERGFRKEAQELLKGAAHFRKIYRAGAGQEAAEGDANSGTTRVKSASNQYSKGQQYLKAALEARDGAEKQKVVELPSSESLEQQAIPQQDDVVVEEVEAGSTRQQRI